MKFRRLLPYKGYRNEYLWLPKEAIRNLRGIKTTLTFPQDLKAPIYAWDETETHLMVPREFIPKSQWFKHPYEFEDISYQKFPSIQVMAKAHPRGLVQHEAYEALLQGSGILSLPPGKGKTVVALMAWCQMRTPMLVVVHTKDLLEQWVDRIIEHTTVRPEDIGVYGDGRAEWEHPICVASIRTLAARCEADELPDGFQEHFGIVAYDEVHHLGAPFFNQSAAVGLGVRWGLSATPDRGDGLDKLYQYHLGDLLYVNREYDIIPEVFFIRTGIEIPGKDLPHVRDRTGQVSIPKLLTWLAKSEKRNDIILRTLDNALGEGRRILALSSRVEHLQGLADSYEDAGLVIGKVKGGDRKDALQEKDLVFATTQLATEGLDKKVLDTLGLLLPLTKEQAFRQLLGRIQRESEDKLPPIAFVIEDEKISACLKMCQRLRHHLDCFEYPYTIVRSD